MQVNYVRCKNCSCVYSDELKECPRCKEPLTILEDLDNSIEPVFNICD